MAAPMPTIGGGNVQANLANDVSNLAPLASTWHGASTGSVGVQNVTSGYTPAEPALSKFTDFIGSVAGSIGNIAVSAAKWVKDNTTQMIESPVKFGADLGNEILTHVELGDIQSRTAQLEGQQQTLMANYKAGRILPKVYTAEMRSLAGSFSDLSNDASGLNNQADILQKNTWQDGIDTAALVITVATAGLGKAGDVAITAGGVTPLAEASTADYLMGVNANAFFSNVESAISKLATDPALFEKLEPATQKALQSATADVIASNAPMTAGQIARASAANLALKYPLQYSAIDSVGRDLYTELDNKKYGDAVQTLAFNAGLLLTGGVIGYALKSGAAKGLLTNLKYATFGQTSFWDELSKFYGDGSTDGFAQAIRRMINKIPDAEGKKAFVRDLAAVEATNVNAVGGDATAAAMRVATGMKNYEGLNLTDINHDEALSNMVNFAKAQRIADETAKANGLGAVTVGRVDSRDLGKIGKALAEVPEESRVDVWEQLKSNSPTRAWANNENFDRQVKGLIAAHADPAELEQAIRNVRASFSVAGFPRAVAKQLSKMGYLPIRPVDLRAPFKEGASTIATKFAGSEDFFTKAVQPLPVLSHIGSMLISAGMSPLGATTRVYSIFTQNLTRAFGESKAIKSFIASKGLSEDENAADIMIKKLSSFAHDPTRGGLRVGSQHIRPPIIDLRQLTTKDVMAALNIGASDAREVKGAIMDAMLEVPLAVRGAGDHLMDLAYKVPGTALYSRLQGALRFSWNPVFAAKLEYKTEILSQLEADGQKFPTILGTNRILQTIMPEHYSQLDDIREVMRSRGILDERGHLGVIGGEAVQDNAAIGPNLNHKLLPGQERSIAGLVAIQAKRVGLSPQEFIDNFPHQVADTVQAIAQYDRHYGFLNSPMVRTLNMAFFPFRFDLKVMTAFAKAMSRQPVMTQFALINGLFRSKDFFESPEGQAWYANNADVIGLIKYFTPLDIMSTVGDILDTHGQSIGAYGELGGLPFGWIPQTLDAAGLTHFGTAPALVDPNTGDVIPKYVPTNDRGRLQLAIEDLVGSLFTYPGAIVGLPSKSSITRGIAETLTGGRSAGDFKATQPPLTEHQKEYQQVIRSMHPQVKKTTAPTPGAIPSTAVPTQPTPLTVPKQKTSTATGAKRKKKADFRPALLPGQSNLGEL